MPEQITETSQMQLLVFERKSPRSSWRYMSTYKAGNQEELAGSERAIRGLHNALHSDDGIIWAVVAQDLTDMHPFFSLTKKVGRGRHKRNEGKAVRSLDQMGAVVLTLPENEDSK